MKKDTNEPVGLGKQVVVRLILAFGMMGLLLFLPARTIRYWEAWVYLAIVFTCAVGVVIYFLKHDPGLLERRMKTRERVRKQKLIIGIGWFLFLPTFTLPGFDHYYGWSDIPVYLIIVSDILVLTGYLTVIRVFKENSYASRVVETDSKQKVVTTGPYAVVRHPMYSGIFVMYGFTPLALGSYWAFIGTVILFVIIIVRIYNEEKYLSENLEGYKEYLQRTRYRIIPCIW